MKTYKIMIALGKPEYLYEIWGEAENAKLPSDFTHEGYFETRAEAEAWLAAREVVS